MFFHVPQSFIKDSGLRKNMLYSFEKSLCLNLNSSNNLGLGSLNPIKTSKHCSFKTDSIVDKNENFSEPKMFDSAILKPVNLVPLNICQKLESIKSRNRISNFKSNDLISSSSMQIQLSPNKIMRSPIINSREESFSLYQTNKTPPPIRIKERLLITRENEMSVSQIKKKKSLSPVMSSETVNFNTKEINVSPNLLRVSNKKFNYKIQISQQSLNSNNDTSEKEIINKNKFKSNKGLQMGLGIGILNQSLSTKIEQSLILSRGSLNRLDLANDQINLLNDSTGEDLIVKNKESLNDFEKTDSIEQLHMIYVQLRHRSKKLVENECVDLNSNQCVNLLTVNVIEEIDMD
jgi:hypothetical protein